MNGGPRPIPGVPHPSDALDNGQYEAAPEPGKLPRYWRPAALAKMLDVSRQAIYAAISNGTLPAITIFSEHDPKARGALRILESDVLAYLARCKGPR